MADLAECWGWGPPVMEAMALADLLGWRAEALARRPKE
jgi:hypothetical protein